MNENTAFYRRFCAYCFKIPLYCILSVFFLNLKTDNNNDFVVSSLLIPAVDLVFRFVKIQNV